MSETPNDIQWGDNSPADIKWGAAPTPEPTPSRLRRLVADPAISAVKGAIGIPEAAVGMANIVTGGLAGKAADAVGFRPAAAKATLDTLYSPEQQQANQEVQQAEGFLPTVKATFRNPSTIVHTAIESAPSMLGGAAVAKRLIAGGTAPIVAAATGEGAVSAGSTAEQIRQETGDLTGKQGLISTASGVATGAVGIAGGKVAQKLGVVDPDLILAQGLKGAGKAGAVKAAAGGALSEGVLEEMPQSAQEQAASNLATGKPITEGVSKAAATGAITGAAMGGGFNAAATVAGIGQRAAERRAKLEALKDLPPYERRTAARELADEVHAENPAAAAAMTAVTLDRMDAGEDPLDAETQAVIDDLAKEPEAAPARESLLESLQESIATGGETNVLDVIAGKEEAKVAEALTPDSTDPALTDPSIIRAQTWASTGRVVLKEGTLPDAEVAAHLDDMGLTLVQGARADMTDGGSVARREWVVQHKEETVAAPAATTASVKMMITKDERQQLLDRGYKNAGIDKMKPAEAAQILATPPECTPLADGETRQAYADNPNLMVKRVGNQIAVADVKTKEVLGVAQIKNGKVGTWAEGREPATADERVQIKKLLETHMGVDAPRFQRLYRGDSSNPDGIGEGSQGDLGQGIYFTDDSITAEYFTDGSDAAHTRAFEVGIKNPFSLVDRNISTNPGWVSMMATLPDDPAIGVKPKANLQRWAEGKADVRDPYGFVARSFGHTTETFNAFLAQHGFDGVVSQGVRGVADSAYQYVAFDKAQVEQARFARAGGTPAPAKIEIKSHLAPIIKKLKVPVTVVESAEEIEGLTTDIDFKGVFFQGKIYLNAANLTSIQDAEDTLLRHEIRHAGLRTILGKEGLESVLKKAWGDLKSGVREFAKERGIDTSTKAGKLEATEEYIVELARTDSKSPLWDRFVEIFRKVLRSLGFEIQYTDTELRSLVARAGEAMIVEGETRFSAAWHGGPHDFDKFLTDNIGTGEGAQAYGWGLYFAGAKQVAEWYKKTLAKRTQGTDFETVFDGLTYDLGEWAPTQEEAEKLVRDSLTSWLGTPDYASERDAYVALLGSDKFIAATARLIGDRLNMGKWAKAEAAFTEAVPETKGKLYQVELAPEEDEYLLWDKPLSEQSEKVKGALDVPTKEEAARVANDPIYPPKVRGRAFTVAMATHNGLRGADLYHVLGKDLGGDKAASEMLHSLGVRGIKYLDGSSRSVASTQLPRITKMETDIARIKESIATPPAHWAGQPNMVPEAKARLAEMEKALEKVKQDENLNYNYVIFNDEDVEIKAKFSRVLKNPKEFLNAHAAQVAKRTLSDVSGNIWRHIMAVDRTIELAKSMPLYAPIKDLLGQYVVLRKAKAAATNVPLTYGHQIAADVTKAFKTAAEIEALNTLMAKATIYELHANGVNAGWTEKSWKESGKEEKTGLTLGEAMTEIAALWKPLTAPQKAAHQKMIDHMQILFGQLIEAELEPLKTAYGEERYKAAEDLLTADEAAQKAADPELLELAQQIAEKKSRGQLRGDYTPLMRYGNHIVRTLDAEGNRTALRSFESKQDAINEVAAIRAKGGVAKYELIPESSKAQANIPLAFLDKMRRAAEARGITGDALEQLMDDFTAARVQTLPRTSLAGTTLQREGVEGYDTDMLRAYASYTNKAGHAIAQAKYGRQIEQTFRDMSAAIQARSERPDSQPHELERMSSLKDMLYKQDKAQELERVNDLVKILGKTSFIWYLSSPSIYAVQWAQPFITTIPKMASKYGFGKAFAAYTREAKHFLAGRFSDANIDEFNVKHENAGERLYQLIEEERQVRASAKLNLAAFMKKTEGLSPPPGGVPELIKSERKILEKKAAGIRESMRVLYNGFDDAGKKLLILKVLGLQGVLDISSSHEMMDLITGASDGQKTLNKITSNLAFFMQKSETGSRRAAAVSSFQMALDNGKDFVEANDYAAEMIGDTLGDFTTQNRPELLRGNLGRVIGQFRFYQIHMLGKTVQLMKDAFQEKGWGEKKKEMAFMLGMSMSIAGAAGTPAAMLATSAPITVILAGLSMAFGDPDDPWDLERDFATAAREALGDDVGNFFLKGFPSLLGMDISKRVGMGGLGNIVNGDPPPGLSAGQRAQWAAGRLLGPSFGMATDMMKSYDALAQGELVEAFKASTPKPVKDLFKAAALYQDGAKGGGGRTVVQPEDISPISIALQALGVNPMEVSLAMEERREIAALTTQMRQRRSLLLKRVTDATLDNDMDARDEALEAINAWGSKQPALKITQGELLSALKRGRAAKAGTLTKQEQMVQGIIRGE